MGTTLSPDYILYSYTDPLGRSRCQSVSSQVVEDGCKLLGGIVSALLMHH